MNRRQFLLILALLTLVAPPLAAQNTAPATPLTERLNATLNVPVLKNAIVGAIVRSLDSGETLYEHNPDFALLPASNQKLITATTTLALLGPDFRYTTSLFRTGMIEADGTLTGDLYLKGSGDPSLSSANLKTLAEALAKSGVKKFSGKIVADATRFDEQTLGEGWQWDDEPFDYQPQVSALNCDENVVQIEVRPGSVIGATPDVVLGGMDSTSLAFAGSTYLNILNTATTGSGNDPTGANVTTGISLERLRAHNDVVISGTIPLGGAPSRETVTVENPARFTVTRLYELLSATGITTAKPTASSISTGIVPPNVTLVAEHQSAPLSALVALLLKPSDNLFGECFLRTLGAEKGKAGSWSEGRKVVKNFLTEALSDTSGLYIADGSGLSRMNNVTPRLLADLLTYADKKLPPATRTAFVDGLPVGGIDGTLRNRFKGTPLAGNVRAKTGSLTGVSTLSGYVTTRSGKRLVFSLLMNHFTAGGPTAQARAAQDAFVLALYDGV